LPGLWIGISVVVGITVSIWLITRARTIQAKAIGAHDHRYQQLVEKTATAQEHVTTAVAELGQRFTAIESLLRQVSD
jgi:hypothetical protein